MTRINTIPVEQLADQHLMAEYREMLMVGSSLQRSLKSPRWDKKRIPEQFTLNKGHVMFFYDKGVFLYKRYQQLVNELIDRGYNIDMTRKFNLEKFPKGYRNDWEPNERDMSITRERIIQRINEKPEFYTWRGAKIGSISAYAD